MLSPVKQVLRLVLRATGKSHLPVEDLSPVKQVLRLVLRATGKLHLPVEDFTLYTNTNCKLC
jgi:hypothetical protein